MDPCSGKNNKNKSVFKRLSFPEDNSRVQVITVFNRTKFPNDKLNQPTNGGKLVYHPINGPSYANIIANGNSS
jgi:hypothetical protein